MKATYRLQFNGKQWQSTAINEFNKIHKIIYLYLIVLILAILQLIGRGLIIRWCCVRLTEGPPSGNPCQ